MIKTFSGIAPMVEEINRLESRLFLVIDSNIQQLYGSRLAAIAAQQTYVLEASESGKEIGTVIDICRFLMQGQADRNSVLISIGGGVTSDIAGFVAAIYKRGMSYVSVPTTLLAQVDAAVGGKNGVNLDGFKNVIGTIRQPDGIFYCTEFLSTLPDEEILSGWAETVKTAVIRGGDIYRSCLDAAGEKGILARKQQLSAELIAEISGIKLDIVRQDPYEKGLRRVLNFGHTYGHAIEKEYLKNGKHITHGQAVAMGMILATTISERLNIAQQGICERLKTDFDRFGLEYRCDIPKSVLDRHIIQDKKAEGAAIHFAAIRDIGVIEPVKIYFKDILSIDI